MCFMNYTFINQTNENSWKNYRVLVTLVMKECIRILKIKKKFQFSVILVDSDTIQEINKQYRQKDQVTDVISFASNDILGFEIKESINELGDIFINVDRVRSQALDYGHSLKREFSFLVTHGLLHLLGYDHMNPQEEKEMFQLQEEILSEIAKR